MATACPTGAATEITLTVGDQLYEATFSANARSYSLMFRTNAGKVVESGGTDGAAIGGTDYLGQPGDICASWPVPGAIGKSRNLDTATRKVWLASASAGTVVVVTPRTATYVSGG